MKSMLALALCLTVLGTTATATTTEPEILTTAEERRKGELQDRLCAVKELNCEYVTALFNDPRLTIYYPPKPTSQGSTPVSKEHELNTYLTTRFGLLTTESLERCRAFLIAYAFAFNAAKRIYGVPRAVICGILRIETDFGIPTKLSPHPVGANPAINWLVTIYVRQPTRELSQELFVRRQEFALNELKDLLQAASRFGWDLFQIPGSPTGAVGLAQFEPSSFKIAVDGDGDGKIDLFDPADAILSVAHYLVTRGWDDQPQHQHRAIYAYYGGNYDADPNKYYMRAVLKYADEVGKYLKYHPVEPGTTLVPEKLSVHSNKRHPLKTANCRQTDRICKMATPHPARKAALQSWRSGE